MAQVATGGGTVTPTLIGRWQTRIATLLTIGLLVSLIFTLLFRDPLFLVVLAYVAGFGLIWDIVYSLLQKLRWDRDWPSVFVIITGIWEGLFLYVLTLLVPLPGIGQRGLPLELFLLHYSLVFALVFLWIEGPMRAFFPFWRFHGGRIVPDVGGSQSDS